MDMNAMGDSRHVPNGGANPYLADLDISSSQFNTVHNFGNSGGAPLQNGHDDSVYSEQSLVSENEADLNEQRQAMEQAKMMAHFKQLRTLQQQQQQDLMRQQQQKMQQMRAEQEKVQQMLSNARQTKWGGGANVQHKRVLPAVPNTPPRSPMKKPGHHSKIKHQAPTTPVKRPVPVLPSAPSTPSEYRVNGNPDLDSETASVYADNKLAQLQDGFAPLPSDSASEDGGGENMKYVKGPGNGGYGENDDVGTEDGFVMRTGRLDFGDSETASQPDLASIHELTSAAWRNKSMGAAQPINSQPHSIMNQNGPVHNGPVYTSQAMPINQSAPIRSNANTNGPLSIAQNASMSVPAAQNMQPPPGYINLLQLPNILHGLPPNILEQLLHLQQQGQSVVIDGNGHLAVHDMYQGHLLPAGGMLGGLGLGGQPPPNSGGMGPVAQPPTSQPQVSHDPPSSHSIVGAQNQVQTRPNNRRKSDNEFDNVGIPPRQNTGVINQNSGAKTSNFHGNDSHGFYQQEGNHNKHLTHGSQADNPQFTKNNHHPIQLGDTEVQNPVHTESTSEPLMDYDDKQKLSHPSSRTNRQLFNRTEPFQTHESNTDTGEYQGSDEEEIAEDEGQYEEEHDQDSEDDREEQNNDTDGEDNQPETFDDQPVGGLGTRKTFEQLLEEELRKEQQGNAAPVAHAAAAEVAPKAPAKRTFLKKGQGVARFGVGGKPPPPREKKVVPKKKSSTVSSVKSSGYSREATKPAPSKAAENKQAPSRKTTSLANKGRPVEKLNLKGGQNKPPPNPAHQSTIPKQDENERASKMSTRIAKAQAKTRTKSSGSSREGSADRQTDSSSQRSSESDAVGEISFQNRMQEIAQNEQVEEKELDEFEILEQYADDNASFLSNVSVVNRVLRGEEKRHKHSAIKSSHNQPKTVPEVENEADDTLAESMRTEDGDSETDDNLENTLKSDDKFEKAAPNLESVVPQSKSSVNTESRRLGNLDVSLSSSVGNASLIATLQSLKIQRKVASLDERSKNMPSSKQTEMADRYESSDDEGYTHEAQNRFSKNHSASYKRTSVENEQKEEEFSNRKTDVIKDEFSTEDEPDEDKDSEIDFGDEEAWDEDSKMEDEWEQEFLKAKSGKSAKHSITRPSADVPQAPSPPPTSQLVAKLFPKLKPQKPQLSQNQEEKLVQPQRAEIGDGVQAKLLKDKLAELEREVERFRQENATLEKLRKEREEGLSHLKKEMSEFEKQKTEELKRIQDMKNEEMKKLKKERKVFEEYQKNMRNQPNKKEREEIEMLKQQVEDLQDEMKRKEQRWTSSTTRLRDRIESLETENGELKEEIKILEKRRLEEWQKREAQRAGESNIKPSRESLGSTHSSSFDTAPTSHQVPNHNHQHHPSSSHRDLQKSHSGPQFSSRTKQPTPHKKSKHSMHRDKSLRLSQNDLRRSVQSLDSLDSQSLQPEDSASNVATSRSSREYGMSGMGDLRQSQSLNASQESLMDKSLLRAAKKAGHKKHHHRKKTTPLVVSSAVEKGDGQFEEIQHADGKVERVYSNGAREILFSNGTRKQVSADGQSIIVSFFNGDIKQILPDQRVVYYYAEAQTTHTTYPDGLEILQFPNNQIEKHYPDGTKEITFPDQTIKYLFPNGIEENLFPNGTVIRVETNGDKTMQFANGQREIHTAQYKRREYPDGTVKTVYPDGRQETRYSSGRIRVKDKDGAVVMDKRV